MIKIKKLQTNLLVLPACEDDLPVLAVLVSELSAPASSSSSPHTASWVSCVSDMVLERLFHIPDYLNDGCEHRHPYQDVHRREHHVGSRILGNSRLEKWNWKDFNNFLTSSQIWKMEIYIFILNYVSTRTRYDVTKPNGGHGDEAEVKSIKECQVFNHIEEVGTNAEKET